MAVRRAVVTQDSWGGPGLIWERGDGLTAVR